MGEDSNRRRLPRYPCTGAVEIFQGGKLWGWGSVSEIGLGGCFIDTNQPLPAGTAVQLRLAMADATLEVGATVAWTTPQVGMGVRFEAASPEIGNQIVQVLKFVTGAGEEDLLGASSGPAAQPSEFLVPESAVLPLGCEVISPEAAPGILAKIIERVQETGALTEQELLEIVKAGQ